jgi:hypothetical protein
VIERAIENWLIRTNERNYLRAYCQVLTHSGYRVLHYSTHGPTEQGKDIIAIAPDGVPCGFQTKTGLIDTAQWRDIRGEIEELTELPIDFPGVDKKVVHRAYLVTNGVVTDPVRIQINDRNEDNQRKGRNYAALEVISGDALLAAFIGAQGQFIPRALPDIRQFLDLYLDVGTGMLPKEKLFAVLWNTSFSAEPKTKSSQIDAVSSSVVITSYLLNSFEQSKNFFALFEGWTVLAACIVRFAAKHKIPDDRWMDSVKLAIDAAEQNLVSLRKDIEGREDFVEGGLEGDGGIILIARTTICLGALCCLELSEAPPEAKAPDVVLGLVRTHFQRINFWGESAFPLIYYIARFLDAQGSKDMAKPLLEGLFALLVDRNFTKTQAFAPPYYGVQEVLESQLGTQIPPADFSGWAGSSYILRSLLHILVRRDSREFVARNWRRYTYCQEHEFAPALEEDIFSWRVADGANISRFPNQTESWATLKREAADRSSIPALYTRFQALLHYYILACPHRITPTVMRVLDAKR